MSRFSKLVWTAIFLAIPLSVWWFWPRIVENVMSLANDRTDLLGNQPCSSSLLIGGREHLLDGSFVETRSAMEISPILKQRLTRHGPTEQAAAFHMADPGLFFASGPVVLNPELPRKRLIFAGSSIDRVFVFYEQGGPRVFRNLIVLHRASGCDLWTGSLPDSIKVTDIDELRRALPNFGIEHHISGYEHDDFDTD